VVQRYFGAEEDAVGPGGWFDTGDVGIIHPDGTLQLTDRTKDVIKSGGEWISSVELENAAVGHPDVAEAAAIGIAHPKWDERPLLVVVRKPGRTVEAEDIRRFLSTRVAKWWLPDAVEFVAELPTARPARSRNSNCVRRFAAIPSPTSRPSSLPRAWRTASRSTPGPNGGKYRARSRGWSG